MVSSAVGLAIGPVDAVGDPSETGMDARDGLVEGSATAGADSRDAAEAVATGADGDDLHMRTALALTPSEPGVVRGRITFTIPDRVVSLKVTLPSDAEVTATDGFTREEGEWVWDGETASPSITAALQANRTAVAGGPLGADGSYLFVDVGPWAIVRSPNIGIRWTRRGGTPVTFAETLAVDGEGVAGENLAYLGPSRTRTRTVEGQTFRLVVPAAADLAESPSAIFDSMAQASKTLQVGPRDDEVVMVVAPTGQVGWAVRGLEVGGADFWVRDTERLATPGNVWIHEYVHTRQTFRADTSGKWAIEAVATWYAALLTLEQGRIGFDEFARFLRIGATEPQGDAILSQPGTWEENAHYFKGALVVGELDRRIRLATGHERSFQTVFSRLNGMSDPVTNADVLAAVEDAAGTETRRTARRFTTSSDAPEVWDEAAHEEAFGPTPARMTVAIQPDGFRVEGPYRTADLEAPVTVATNETLFLTATVANEGGTAGDYAVELAVDGTVVATREGRLAAGDSATLTLAVTFDEPGKHTLSLGGKTMTVSVAQPSMPRVASLHVDDADVPANSTVTATVEVGNPTAVPAVGNVTVTRDGSVVARRHVVLQPGENRTVRVPVSLSTPGNHRIAADGASVTVRVTSPTEPTTSTRIPGFGVVAGGLAVLVAALLLGRRGRSQGRSRDQGRGHDRD